MIERIKIKLGYKILAGIFVIFGLFYGLNYINNYELNKIKNNPNIEVICDIKGLGEVEVDKNKLVTIMDDGTFVFENRYAKNCQVYENNF